MRIFYHVSELIRWFELKHIGRWLGRKNQLSIGLEMNITDIFLCCDFKNVFFFWP